MSSTLDTIINQHPEMEHLLLLTEKQRIVMEKALEALIQSYISSIGSTMPDDLRIALDMFEVINRMKHPQEDTIAMNLLHSH